MPVPVLALDEVPDTGHCGEMLTKHMCVIVSQQFDWFAGVAGHVFAQSLSMLHAPHIWPDPVVAAVVDPVVPAPVVVAGDVVTVVEDTPPAPPVFPSPDAQARKRAGPTKARTAKVRAFFTGWPSVLQAFVVRLREMGFDVQPHRTEADGEGGIAGLDQGSRRPDGRSDLPNSPNPSTHVD